MHFRRSRAAAIRILGPLCLLATLGASGHAQAPVAVPGTPPERPPSRMDYARDVRPILAGRCQACHGPVLRKNGLRLDVPGGAVGA